MARFGLILLGIILLVVMALGLLWLLGQLLVGIGAVVVSVAGVLSRLVWFLIVAGVASGLVYFVASAWRPAFRHSVILVGLPDKPEKKAKSKGKAAQMPPTTMIPIALEESE